MRVTDLEYGQSEEFRSGGDVAGDVKTPTVVSCDQVDRLDRVAEVVDPVQATGGVVDGQAERLVEVLTDEDLTVGSVETRSLDLRHRSEIGPVQ